jgi:hypothetical protein
MDDTMMDRALVRTILEHAEVQPWKMQDAGLLGLWLGPSRRYRLHVWDPVSRMGDLVIHDHPLDFTSTVIGGEITNTRYEMDPAGDEFVRERYAPGDEAHRRTDSVRLSGTSTTFGPGESYSQAALELHSSSQVPGTVTVLRFTYVDVPLLTTCRREGSPWISGRSRPAEPDEIQRITASALALLE